MTVARKKWLWLGAFGGVLIAVLVFAFMPAPVSVDIAVIERGPLMVTVGGEGKTRIKDIYTVSAPIAGRVSRIEIEAGDAVVAAETLLVSIEPMAPQFLDVRSQAQAEARLREAGAAKALSDAGLEKAGAELAFAQSELDRAQGLNVGEAISRRTLDNAERLVRTKAADVVIAEASVRVAEFQLAAAQAALIGPADEPSGTPQRCCIELRAPVSGRVLRVLDASSRIVTSGEPLLEIGDPGSIEAVADLLSTDAVKVREGAEAFIEHWGGDVALKAKVRVIEPSGFTKISALGIEEQRVNVILDFADPPEMRLPLGDHYRIEARIVVWRGENVLRVPVSALFRDAGDWAVFIAEGGRVAARTVKIGRRNSRYAEIQEGAKEGDLVVAYPGDRVAEGVRVVQR